MHPSGLCLRPITAGRQPSFKLSSRCKSVPQTYRSLGYSETFTASVPMWPISRVWLPAIGRGGDVGVERATGTGLVVDQHGLTGQGDAWADGAGQDVGAATGRERDDDAHRFAEDRGGLGLRQRRGGGGHGLQQVAARHGGDVNQRIPTARAACPTAAFGGPPHRATRLRSASGRRRSPAARRL